MDFDLLHDATFYVLDGLLVLLTFVIVERALFYIYAAIKTRRLERAMRQPDSQIVAEIAGLRSDDMMTSAVRSFVREQQAAPLARSRVEDLSSSIYLSVDSRMNARLWLLDMIVTAAPLLGLLGTILGIMQTFSALSQGGISDPGAVSRGIGNALLATAVGIVTALLGLVGHAILHRQAESIMDSLKTFLLRTTR